MRLFGSEGLDRPFEIEISKKAQIVNYDRCPGQVRDTLCRGRSFNTESHNIYEFSIVPKFLESSKGSNRDLKKNLFSKVDNVRVQARLHSEDIELLGIYPRNVMLHGKHLGGLHLDIMEGEILLELNPRIAKLKLVGRARGEYDKKRSGILAWNNDEQAQWVFLKDCVRSQDFSFDIYCEVPKDQEGKYISCDAVFADGKRKIKDRYNQRVFLPNSS